MSSPPISEAQLLLYITIGAAIVRLSLVFLLTFIVRVLLILYSYHVRMAAFYNARADALLLVQQPTVTDYERLVRTLSPEHVKFGEVSEITIEEIAKLLKLVTGSGKE
jgi:hypothetical protein